MAARARCRVALASLVGLGFPAAPTWAVDTTKLSISETGESPLSRHQMTVPASQEFLLPVTWQVTRARFDERGHSSDSESFQEIWRLHLDAAGEGTLHSPRDSVRVASISMRGASPELMTVAAADMARLTGLLLQHEAPTRLLLRTFTIRLTGEETAQDVILDVAEEEHLALRVLIGTQRL